MHVINDNVLWLMGAALSLSSFDEQQTDPQPQTTWSDCLGLLHSSMQFAPEQFCRISATLGCSSSYVVGSGRGWDIMKSCIMLTYRYTYAAHILTVFLLNYSVIHFVVTNLRPATCMVYSLASITWYICGSVDLQTGVKAYHALCVYIFICVNASAWNRMQQNSIALYRAFWLYFQKKNDR